MARVIIDARNSGTSTGTYIDKLVENIHALKPKIDIAVLAKSHRLEHFKKIAPNFELIKCDVNEFGFGEQYGLVWQLYGLKNDLAHFGMPQQPVLYFGATVTTIHDLTTTRFGNPATSRLIFGGKQQVYKWLIKMVARKSAYIITPSKFVKQDVAQYAKIDPAKIAVTYEAADKITAKAEAVNSLMGQEFIMYVGRPQPHKNLWRLVEAFTQLQKDRPKLKLVLVGKKDKLYDQLEQKVLKNNIGGVTFTGFASEGQLRWLYENCAAYVFPSLSEGFGLPGLEAMVHGAPVVSSKATCLPEIYGQAALYFDPLDIADMTKKIDEVLSDQKLRAKLSANGYKQSASYSWQRMAQQTLDIYNKVVEKNT